MNYILFRQSCYSCKFATIKRCTDITIADFHTPEKLFNYENRLNGFSSILCNTEKGKEIIKELELNVKTISKEEIQRTNASLNGPVVSSIHESFEKDSVTLSIDDLARKYGFYSRKTTIKRLYYKAPRCLQRVIRKAIIKEV